MKSLLSGPFDKSLSRNLFTLGAFVQISWFCPNYLDRTGMAISRTQEEIDQWQGDAATFNFHLKGSNHIGNVSVEKLWFSYENQEYYSPENLWHFFQEINKSSEIIAQVYEPETYTRLGFRFQAVYAKSQPEKIKAFHDSISRIFLNPTENGYMVDEGFFVTKFKKKELNIRTQVSFAAKKEDKKLGPEKGFLIDLDFYEEPGKHPFKDKAPQHFQDFTDKATNRINETLSFLLKSLGI
jgi:uncharacterized protein (TIGR04255 family)